MLKSPYSSSFFTSILSYIFFLVNNHFLYMIPFFFLLLLLASLGKSCFDLEVVYLFCRDVHLQPWCLSLKTKQSRSRILVYSKKKSRPWRLFRSLCTTVLLLLLLLYGLEPKPHSFVSLDPAHLLDSNQLLNRK